MRVTRRGWLVGGVLVLSMLAAVPSAPTPLVEEPPVRLTTATLGTMLRDLGYEPVEIKSRNGDGGGYAISVSRNERKVRLELSLGPADELVRIVAPLATVQEPDKAPGDRYVKLLEENDRIRPASFSYAGQRIALGAALGNDGVTPVRLRKQLDTLVETVRRTETLWDASKWPRAGTPPWR